jgi:hypothetical protein
MKKLVATAAAAMIAAGLAGIAGCGSNTAAEPSTQGPRELLTDETVSEKTAKTGGGMLAVQKAAEAKKYLFALFRKEEDGQTAAMRSVLQEVMKEVTDRADSVEVNVTAVSERAIVDKFGLDRAPMPLILAVAPNGAITGGFPTKAEKQNLLQAFASPCMEKCMKSLQENKLVFLCIQNSNTKANSDAMQGVHDFQADERFARATQIVTLDPTDATEAEFLKDLQVDPKTAEATTVFLAPPGVPIAMYQGATKKDELVATLSKASSACGPGGCGPGGCAPK